MTDVAQHTPGPWKANQTEPAGDWCIHAAGIPWQLAYLSRSTQIEWPLEANARLVAAAPELLAVLEDLVDRDLAYSDNAIVFTTEKHGDVLAIVRRARDAIAKARA